MSIPVTTEKRNLTGKLNQKLLAMPPSGIRRFFDLVIGMEDVVSLGVGEPDFVTPECVREKAAHDLAAGHTTYTSNSGLLALRQELAQWLHRKYDVTYDPVAEMLITVGASEAIDLALRAICNPGDEVIVLQPCYVSYAPSVELAGGVPVLFPTWQADGFRANLEELQKVVTPRTKAIMLNFPSNPCGHTFDREDLEQLADFVKSNDIIAISDEIYAELTYDKQHVSLASLPGMKDYTILINGFSKSHAMTGWRLGYSCAPAEITAAMLKIHQYTMLCAPTLSQYAAIEALQCCERAVADMRAEYKTRRDVIINGFNRLGLKALMPEGAFYAFADVRETGLSSEDFCMKLLEEEKVAVVPGSAFGDCGEGFIRASYASSLTKIETALNRMESFLNRRK